MSENSTVYKNHEKLIDEYLAVLGREPSLPGNISWFVSEARNWFLGKSSSDKPGIGMVGIYFPEVFIHALGARPVWILGGSGAVGEAVDDSMPRDVDPVVRSAVGYVSLPEMEVVRKCSLIIVPLLSDSIKKSIPLFPEECNVHPFDVCHLLFAVKTAGWEKELGRALAKLEEVTGRTLEPENLKSAMSLVNQAADVLQTLYRLYHGGSISSTMYFFLRQSYYMTADLPRWIREMTLVTEHYRNLENDNIPEVYIGLTGSPSYLPYNKIPGLLDSLGMTAGYIDVGFPELTKYEYFGLLDDTELLVGLIGDKHYHETYGACHLTTSAPAIPRDVHGIVFHFLKGQLNYAFMNEKLDRQAVRSNVPMITVETDYGGADIEQLRIRLEAFREMALCR